MDAVGSVPAARGLEDDPDVYAAVKNLMLHAVDCAVDILDTAAPAQQLQMIRILLPRAASSLRAREDDTGRAELQGTVDLMYGTIRRALGEEDDPDEVPADEVPADA